MKSVLALVFLVACLFPVLGIADDNSQCVRKPENTCKPIKHVAKSAVQRTVLPKENIYIINNNTNINGTTQQQSKVKRVTIERTVYGDERKNAISALVVRSATGLQVSQPNSTTFDARTTQQLDVGAMYQRDVGAIRLSVGATIGGTVMGGVGFKF